MEYLISVFSILWSPAAVLLQLQSQGLLRDVTVESFLSIVTAGSSTLWIWVSQLPAGHLVTLLQHKSLFLHFFLILIVSTSKGFWYHFLFLSLFMSLKDTFTYCILLHWDQLLIDGYRLVGVLRQSPECTSPLSLPALFWHLGSSLLSFFFILSSTCLSWA